MEALLVNQNELVQAMEQLLSSFKKAGRERRTVEYVSKKLETLDTYWKEFHRNHSSLCSYEDKNNIPYFVGNHYDQALNFYNNTKAHIEQALPKPTTPISSPRVETKTYPIPGPSTSKVSINPIIESRGSTSELEEMLQKQRSNFKAFAHKMSVIELDNLTEKWQFEDILRTLQSRWSAIDDLHWEIDGKLTLISENNPEYEASFFEYEKQFSDIKLAINRKMWSTSYREQSTPKMEIPTFSGNYHQWLSFKDLFTETIHTNGSLSNAQKMQFLKGKLRGEAEKLVQHLRISSDNYHICWDILNNRYNNTKLIFSSHINTLLTMPVIQNQSAASIKKLHDTTIECLNAVKGLGLDTSTWDPLVVHILAQKLDVDSHNEYIASLLNPRDLPTLDDFLKFLEVKFISLESSRRKPEQLKKQLQENSTKNHWRSSVNTNHSNIAPNKSFINHITNKTLKKPSKFCPLCKNNHALYQCKTFLLKENKAKRDVIAKLNLCNNCLYSHNGIKCNSTKTCRHCHEKHNTLLHDALATTASDRSSGSPPIETDQQILHTCVSQAAKSQAESLLATAKIKVQAADGNYHIMRALVDPCAQSSLITENAAQRLALQRKGCKWIVFGVGSKANQSKGVVDIIGTSIHDDFTFSTKAFIMKNMIHNANLPYQTIHKPNWNSLKEVKLADPEYYISQPIDLILSVDVYTQIILPGLIREKSSPHIAQNTKLGWMISGKCAKKDSSHSVIMVNLATYKGFGK
ncbi:PREDICTED: uncharacterized protein LOC106109495 [Papilio polytes]|uniref:uncharacterized protein LOC106109495 n=1 Tax=Papilio polytes TaxID=76194 RepID=UPI000675C4D4|nr:PREDICTED: uncharacterized protein LOC106109495 [Papilio polytes]